MNPAKCDEMDYINFLIAAQHVFSSVEASQTHPAQEQAPAHNAYTRLLKRLPPNSQALWQEVKLVVNRITGVDRGQYRLEVSQRNHIGLVIRAFVRLEAHRLRTGISCLDAKTGIIHSAMRLYLAHPTINLGSTA